MVHQEGDGRYTVDIRVFILMIVAAMAVSFGVGVSMGPTASDLLQASLSKTSSSAGAGSAASTTGLPEVTSVQMSAPLGVPGSDDLHEPAGQVSFSFVDFCWWCICIFFWMRTPYYYYYCTGTSGSLSIPVHKCTHDNV